MKERTKEAIFEKLELILRPFCFANFHSGTSPNTFYAMQTITKGVQCKCPNQYVEFQVFFNDNFIRDFKHPINFSPNFLKLLYVCSAKIIPWSSYIGSLKYLN